MARTNQNNGDGFESHKRYVGTVFELSQRNESIHSQLQSQPEDRSQRQSSLAPCV